ncbi:hypothetical protein [Arthrobacter sp. L77]|uniref:hypothetical protein n=1 Tax=Arthrobacter sp. L77 TaxID=1496689 RepID=UPI0012E03199|nr:hypothetical protein [Arthrobacter sp. L77]
MPTHFALYPATRPAVGEYHESELTSFFRSLRETTGITQAGLAEIKPHNPPAIRKGLAQLRDYLNQSEIRRHQNAGQEPKRESIWLLTYLAFPENAKNPTHLRVFAHKIRREELLKSGQLPSLDRLILSKRELPRVKLPKFMPFPDMTKPDMFGLAVEDSVRNQFAEVYKRPGTHAQTVNRKGADILWRELAGLYYELGHETGDRYWREVADELSSDT